MSLAGFHCKPDHIISADNFNKLQLVAANLCNDDYVDRADVFLKAHIHPYPPTHTLTLYYILLFMTCNDDYVDRADVFLKVHSTHSHTHSFSHCIAYLYL